MNTTVKTPKNYSKFNKKSNYEILLYCTTCGESERKLIRDSLLNNKKSLKDYIDSIDRKRTYINGTFYNLIDIQLILHLLKYNDSIIDYPQIIPLLDVYYNYKSILITKDLFLFKTKIKSPYRLFDELYKYLFLGDFAVPQYLKAYEMMLLDELKDKIFLANYISHGKSFKTYLDDIKPAKILTKHHYKYLFSTPTDLRFKEAFLRSQILHCGGDELMVNSFLRSNLLFISEKRLAEDIIPFFCKFNMVDKDKISEVIDFLGSDRNLSLKGRTINSVIRLSDEWHQRTAKMNKVYRANKWDGYRIEDYKKRVQDIEYKIVQLTTAKQLTEEGNIMNHCVASYANSCAKGSCSIFSLRKFKNDSHADTIATIELRQNDISQIRGKRNERVIGFHRELILEWAEKESLYTGKYAF